MFCRLFGKVVRVVSRVWESSSCFVVSSEKVVGTIHDKATKTGDRAIKQNVQRISEHYNLALPQRRYSLRI